MTSKFAKKKIASWQITKLKPHPRQGVFRPHSTQEIIDLAGCLDREGLVSPVEITPDGFIICGHGRVAAAKHLGWETIHVWIRRDLASKGEDAVFQRLVEDNLHRRFLSKLGIGRAYLALKEQEYAEWRRKDQEQARGDFRDYLGALLGCDGTTAERWARLAVLPCEYDQLVESNLLTQQQAAKIVKRLPADRWENLGKKLALIAADNLDRKGKKLKIRAVVDGQIGCKSAANTRTQSSWHQDLLRALGKVSQDLPPPMDEFVKKLDHSNGCQSVMETLRRKHPQQLSALRREQIEVDKFDVAQLRRSVLLILGVLHSIDATQN